MQEYIKQYLITKDIKECYRHRNKYKRDEFYKIIERWLVSEANESKSGIYKKIHTRSAHLKKMEEELNYKKILKTKSRYGVTIREIISIVNNGLDRKIVVSANNTRPFSLRHSCGWNVDICLHDRRRIIIRMPMSRQLFRVLNRYNINDLTNLFLRYSTLINMGQQWSIPYQEAKHLMKKYGVRYEGFASPLNSSIFATQLGGKFFSLFPDTDSIFGSLGNFFNEKLYSDEKKHYMINPCWSEDLIEKTSDKIIKDLKSATKLGKDVMVVYILPTWVTSSGYIKIQKCGFLRFKKVLMGGEHYFIHGGEKKVTKAKTTFFVLDTYDANVDYSGIADFMVISKMNKSRTISATLSF